MREDMTHRFGTGTSHLRCAVTVGQQRVISADITVEGATWTRLT
jgi:hypothetical protein